MPRLKFAVVLPIAQLLLAILLLQLGHQVTVPRGVDTPFAPTFTMVCIGINAPALLVKGIAHFIPLRLWLSPMLGFDMAEMLFLIGIVITWFSVGRMIDNHGLGEGGPNRRHDLILGIALLLLAALLFAMAWPPIRNTPGTLAGGITAGSLCFVWSGLLLYIGFVRLAKGVRGRPD